jgi:hypothetical protein
MDRAIEPPRRAERVKERLRARRPPPARAYADVVSDPVGLERLPSDVASSVDALTAVLGRCASDLDPVIAQAGDHALEAVEGRRAACGLAAAELLAAVYASRRPGPDRSRLAGLARAVDRTAEAIEAVAWAWARHPVPELANVLRALRDATRAAARAAASLEDEAARRVWDARCREHEAEARALSRAGRAALLGRQDDVFLAAAAQDLLGYATLWLDALVATRAAVLRFSLT